jgi:aldehyde dehydrogenase (NAD+)
MTTTRTVPVDEPTARGMLPPATVFIGGEYVRGAGGVHHTHIHPGDGKPLGEWALAGAPDVDRAVESARSAQRAWAAVTPAERRDVLNRVADAYRDHHLELAAVAALEMGMPIRTAVAGTLGAVEWFRYYAGWADKIEGQVVPAFPIAGLDYTLPEPYGVVAVIIPWNGPVGSIGMKAGPALAAGNTVVIKPPELSPFAAIRFGELALEAGIPPGVINVLPAGPAGGEALVRHPKVAKVSFTGGSATARLIAATAAEALTPLVLELGGKSANIIFPDADLASAVPFAQSMGAMACAGQGCVLPTRLFVHDGVYDEVVDGIVGLTEQVRLGDPLDPTTQMGPVISAGAADRILGVIERARSEKSGTLLTGGSRRGGELAEGYFVEPTVFGDVDPGSHLSREEIFGPVLSISRFGTDEEVIEAANNTDYGLGAYLFTKDIDRAHRMAEELDAGSISINGFGAIGPSAPFGGNKASGYGREGGKAGLDEFLRPKNVFVGRQATGFAGWS